jgi:peptidoglycan/xylan/chitin deacetylase (PgdA/CDA1 family)
MNRIKGAILRGLQRSGAFAGMAESRWRRERLLILCYHGISIADEHEVKPAIYMAAPVFESRLEFLRSGGYSVLPLEEALSRLSSHTLPPKSVVITFDDGMYNFYSQAFPLLQKYGYPVTLYLTTYYCGSPFPVFPLLCGYMLRKKRGTILKSNPVLGLTGPLDLSTSAGRSLTWKQMTAYADKKQWIRIDQLNELAKVLGDYLDLDFYGLVSRRLFHLMTPEEIKILSKQGVDIQLHTHRHQTPRDRHMFEREITENRLKIEELTGKQARHFCYPSGDYQAEYLSWLSELGVSSAATCDPGLGHAKTNPLLLPRFLDASNVSPIEFESWLTGVGALMRRPWPGNLFRTWRTP